MSGSGSGIAPLTGSAWLLFRHPFGSAAASSGRGRYVCTDRGVMAFGWFTVHRADLKNVSVPCVRGLPAPASEWTPRGQNAATASRGHQAFALTHKTARVSPPSDTNDLDQQT